MGKDTNWLFTVCVGMSAFVVIGIISHTSTERMTLKWDLLNRITKNRTSTVRNKVDADCLKQKCDSLDRRIQNQHIPGLGYEVEKMQNHYKWEWQIKDNMNDCSGFKVQIATLFKIQKSIDEGMAELRKRQDELIEKQNAQDLVMHKFQLKLRNIRISIAEDLSPTITSEQLKKLVEKTYQDLKDLRLKNEKR